MAYVMTLIRTSRHCARPDQTAGAPLPGKQARINPRPIARGDFVGRFRLVEKAALSACAAEAGAAPA
jgi:hypothetical protein